MNIYFDYDSNGSNLEMTNKLSLILVRIKVNIYEVLSPLKDALRDNWNNGFILITIKPIGNKKEVIGFNEDLSKKIDKLLSDYDMETTILDCMKGRI